MRRILWPLSSIPGAIQVAAFTTGVAVRNLWPNILSTGGMIRSLTDSDSALIMMLLVGIGTSIDLVRAPRVLLRGLALAVAKIAPGIILGLIALRRGSLLGLSPVVIVAAMTCASGGLCWSLIAEYGDREDIAATSVRSVAIGPFLTLLVLGAGGQMPNLWTNVVRALAPLALGVGLNALDHRFRHMLGGSVDGILLFLMFSMGTRLDTEAIVSVGVSGLGLGLLTFVTTGTTSVVADIATGGTGIVGAASASTSPTAVAVPAAVALVIPSMQSSVASASGQIAVSAIVTTILTLVLTSHVYKVGLKVQTRVSGS